jgi:hypothetical protein
MRVESEVTSLSWIPSEAVAGLTKVTFSAGFTHYDDPPPDVVSDLEELRENDRFRFANRLTAWADFDGERLVGCGTGGGGAMGSTTVRLGSLGVTFAAVGLPDLVGEPQVGDGCVRFTQTTGGRTALPYPRRIASPPFVRLQAPLVWTKLALTLWADGRTDATLAGASPFPRHWVYGADGTLVAKAGLTDFTAWSRQEGKHRTPWGAEDSPVLVTAAETALERELSRLIMRGGAKPAVRTLAPGDVLVREGDAGQSLFLLLDGVVSVETGGSVLAELGPGAVVGERAVLERGRRTATLTAVTPIRVAEAPADRIDRSALERLAGGHRREEGPPIGETISPDRTAATVETTIETTAETTASGSTPLGSA